MKQIDVFDGNQLMPDPVPYPERNACCAFMGTNRVGGDIYVPFDADLLSRHLMFRGGIGTGKTNAFFQIVRQLRAGITRDDVMIIFDTKGDFYKQFYRPGDIVISNDETATGQDGTDYWNIFNEIELDEHMEENIVEISKSLFRDKVEKSSQPFFPNAAKDLFGAILTHFTRNKGRLESDNASLRAFLDKSPTRELREMLEQYDDMRALTSYISEDRSAQTQGVMSELLQLTREIFLGNFTQKIVWVYHNIWQF